MSQVSGGWLSYPTTILSGKQNADANDLSRVHDPEIDSTIFPEVLNATVQSQCMSQVEHRSINILYTKQ